MEQNWLILMQEQTQLESLMTSSQSGLSLTEEQARQLLQENRQTLQEQQRVEFGPSITEKIIRTFGNSPYLNRDNYAAAISQLQDIFYLYKNEMLDELTDDELLEVMHRQFEEICCGDLDYLANTCLYNFAQAIRAGYGQAISANYTANWHAFDETTRWDYRLYLQALEQLF